MSDKQIIAVVGATGAQGGGLARAILDDPTSAFSVRALTRDVNSDKAKALADRGAEVVAADIDDPASMLAAFTGAFGAYCVTFYWAHFSPEREGAEARTMATAARQAGLQHVVWSTLEDTRRSVPLSDDRMPTLMGKYKVPHFDAKGESDHFFAEAGVPTTRLLASFYWENLIYSGAGPKPDASGALVWTLPMGDSKLAGIASEDIGKCAHGIFKRGSDVVGKAVGIAGDQLTCTEMAAMMTKAFGREVKYNAIPAAVYRSFGFPGADDLGNMFQFYDEFADTVNATRSVEASRALNPELQSFEQWLGANKDRIPL